MSMTPFTGQWTKIEAAHLLRRTMFGATNQQILDAVSNGLSSSVTSLLQIPIVSPPLAYDSDETIATIGTTWVNSVYPTNPQDSQKVENARQRSLASWTMQRLNEEQFSIAEKMCLFWQNHFAAISEFDARGSYDYHMLIRSHALGNFKQLVKDMTINPNMLIFLNGASNNVYSPNENYARELLELYTIGKGPQIGPGDYTNYTEQDVAAGAKILTGFTLEGLRSDTITDVTSVFDYQRHDTTIKSLSPHFGNAVIPNNGSNEYAYFIDIIFQQDEVANHICRKLYRYFVNYDITPSVENNVIAELASTLIANNYEVLPVLEELFKSQHFYDISVRGAIIRGPLDVFYAMFNSTETKPDFTLETNYKMRLSLYYYATILGQNYIDPPSVAGWTAFYQEPSFTKLWINSTNLKNRFDFSAWIALYGGLSQDNENLVFNVLDFLDNLSFPDNSELVIEDIIDVFFPKGADATAKSVLKDILNNGQPDFEWTIQYNDYLSHLGDPVYSDPVKQRVNLVLNEIFHMPQFHVM